MPLGTAKLKIGPRSTRYQRQSPSRRSFWPQQLPAAHLKCLQEYPRSQGADTLSMRESIENAMHLTDSAGGSSN
jgi:hypothetical protein